MKKFIKFVLADPSNKFAFGALFLFLGIGIFYSCVDLEGFRDNGIWIIWVVTLLIVWVVANFIDFKDGD